MSQCDRLDSANQAVRARMSGTIRVLADAPAMWQLREAVHPKKKMKVRDLLLPSFQDAEQMECEGKESL